MSEQWFDLRLVLQAVLTSKGEEVVTDEIIFCTGRLAAERFVAVIRGSFGVGCLLLAKGSFAC